MNQLDTKARLISPDLAERWLKRHAILVKQDPGKRNRHIKKSTVWRYAEDMRAGRWHLNGETIKLGSDGRILDGQHRLMACVSAKESFRSLVVENVDDESFKTIDIGKVRTAGDIFFIDGRQNSSLLAAALVNVWRWEQGDKRAFAQWGHTPSKPELFEILDRHPRIEEYANRHGAIYHLMPTGLAMALVYLLTEKDVVMAELFFSGLATGVGLRADDPVYALRERLLKDRALKPRPLPSTTAELVLRAWSATRKGEKLTRMQRPRGTVTVPKVSK